MPTKYAARTGILSTRWKSLWTFVPTIDFNNCGGVNRKDESTGSCMDFVDGALLLHNLPNINKFLLPCGNENPYRLNSWICTAIKRRVQELVITRTPMATVVELPRNLFTSVDLVVLKLTGQCALAVSLDGVFAASQGIQDTTCCDGCLLCGAPENVPKCFSLSLETIEFNGFSGCKSEMRLVRYLLENAMVLKKLTLHSWSRNEKIETDL
ncbi:hypothetical protein RHMOL_Rhmol04G0102700 [Rhododendron molle]|uniref:Uncharacterized protein n=1 Tax=Rhododendron molle TaxID=49168 RepID=A0ACC0NZ85_RHOML|nr:hypothetical protein RHMOL_Rhmol04G0102700 [Rhododendron molle]